MIDKLEMLIALARERHFGRAAEACHVSQPTLSSAVRALEDLCGAPLVLRGARFVGLTPEGEAVLARARTIVAEARAIRQDLAAMRTEPEGPLRLGVIPTALTMVQQLTRPLLRRHPGLALTIRSMTSQEIAESLGDFRIDAGVSYAGDDAGRPLAGGLTAVPLRPERYALLLPAAQAGGPLSWPDLRGMRLCLLTPDMQHRRMFDRTLERIGLRIAPVVEANSILALASYVLAGDADATVLPEHLARFFARQPGLAWRPLDGGSVPVPEVALIIPPEGRRSLLVTAFLASLRGIDLDETPD